MIVRTQAEFLRWHLDYVLDQRHRVVMSKYWGLEAVSPLDALGELSSERRRWPCRRRVWLALPPSHGPVPDIHI